MRELLITIIVMCCLVAPVYSADQSITHVVIVWLNEDVSEQEISEIIAKTHVLSDINVVQRLKVGKPVASERKTVDDSFALAISVEFKNENDMQQYIVDQTHREYVQSVLAPVMKKIVVYDFQ